MRHENGTSRSPGGIQASHVLTAVSLLLPFLSLACSANRHPAPQPITVKAPLQRGTASWYGPSFQGHRTASGERYDMHEYTAAHPSLPFGTVLEVRNVANGRSVKVRVNDRGPFTHKRIIDLSYAAAKEIGAVLPGTAVVEIFPAVREQQIDVPAIAARFTVQVAAFSEADRAEALRRELTPMYPETVVMSDGTWNRVQVGIFDEQTRAEDLRRELAAIGLSSIVVAAR
jgi:rare lipoprotein A